jgi:PAS domain S-box-containing protein
LLVESVTDYAIFMLDPSGHVATWNAGAERIKGYRAEEIIGRHFSIFYPPEVVASGQCELELRGAAAAGRFEDEGFRVRKDGSRFWANVIITALRNAEGTLVGFAKVTRDLTERRAAEEDRRRLATHAQKERIQEFQERFLGVLGHDLRNPLASMDMGAGLLRQRATDAATLRILDRMDSSSRRMSRMIDQILDLTRSRLAEGLPIDPAPMELSQVLLGIVEEERTAHAPRAIELDCPPLRGTWDRDRLEQVFSNLVSNAVVHGDPAKPVCIDVHTEGESVVVEVQNAGVPIPEELAGQLFHPFRRGERDSRTSKTAGLGLGLYISQEIAVAHGGNIEVRSNGVEGTTFRVTLPRVATRHPSR